MNRCKHTNTLLERGNWGPHRAKRVCIDCGKWLKWEKTQKSHYERAKGIKYKHVVQQTKDKIAESHLHT